MRSRIVASLALAALAGVSSCGHKDATAPENPMVADVYTAGDFNFIPAFTTIAVGGTVRFHLGDDGVPHDVTFRNTPGAPANIPLKVRETVSRTFTVAGTFPFDCFVHPGMFGEIKVQ